MSKIKFVATDVDLLDEDLKKDGSEFWGISNDDSGVSRGQGDATVDIAHGTVTFDVTRERPTVQEVTGAAATNRQDGGE